MLALLLIAFNIVILLIFVFLLLIFLIQSIIVNLNSTYNSHFLNAEKKTEGHFRRRIFSRLFSADCWSSPLFRAFVFFR